MGPLDLRVQQQSYMSNEEIAIIINGFSYALHYIWYFVYKLYIDTLETDLYRSYMNNIFIFGIVV